MSPRSLRPHRRVLQGLRGFTLVELMVALSGGLFLSAVVFALSRDTTRFYQREARVASATLAGLVGFERLKSDLQRAGYLSTPNVQLDPRVSVRPNGAAPIQLQQLAGLRITPDTPNLASNLAYAANITAGQTVTPDQIILSGSYTVTDEFQIASAPPGGSVINLETNSPAMARLGYIGAAAATQDKLIANIFTVGRIVRVVNGEGFYLFNTIASVVGSPQPAITLANPLPDVGGWGTGTSLNVVNVIRYQIRNLKAEANAQWTPLFNASDGAPGEAARTELVREELNAAGQVIAGSSDIVAEYAVDLDFSVSGQLAPQVPGLVRSLPGDGNFATFFVAAAAGDRPQGVRSVRVRLGVRSREADRPANIAGGAGVYRFKVGTNDGWARVRTFQADVALPNQMGVQW